MIYLHHYICIGRDDVAVLFMFILNAYHPARPPNALGGYDMYIDKFYWESQIEISSTLVDTLVR